MKAPVVKGQYTFWPKVEQPAAAAVSVEPPPPEPAPSKPKPRPRRSRVTDLRLSEVLEVLDSLDLAPLLTALSAYRRTGRRGYDLCAMVRAWCARHILDIQYVADLVEDLECNPNFAAICGFGENVPSESCFSRFNTRLLAHPDLLTALVHSCLNNIKESIQSNHRPGMETATLGAEVAIDSTAVPSFGNPNRKHGADRHISDTDARWGRRHKADSYDEMEWYFGYKLHVIADANYNLPLDFSVTSANQNDSTMLPPLFGQTRQHYPWFHPQRLMGDKGYDRQANHRFLRKHDVSPVIHIRKPTSKDGLYDGLFNKDGVPTCMGQVGMEYGFTDSNTGLHLWRCPAEGCHLKTGGTKAIRHCDDETWVDPEDNPRVMGDIPRNSRRWNRLYRKRWSVERVFRSLKHSRLLEDHSYRGLPKITLHATMSVLTFLATSLARLRRGDADDMGWMRVRMA